MKFSLLLLLIGAALAAALDTPQAPQDLTTPRAARRLQADPRACLEVGSATRRAVAQLASDVFWGGDARSDHIVYSWPARGSGIRGYVCPAWKGSLRRVPPTEDCASFVAWLYWTAFGMGPDNLGGRAGWGRAAGSSVAATGHLQSYGRRLKNANGTPMTANSSPSLLQPGDLCFYHGPTTDHVVIHVGNGRVVGLGSSSKFHKYSLSTPNGGKGQMPLFSEVNWIMGQGSSFWFLECRRYEAFPL